jgi:hypothetical protein
MASWTEVVSKVTTEGLEEEAREWARKRKEELRAQWTRTPGDSRWSQGSGRMMTASTHPREFEAFLETTVASEMEYSGGRVSRTKKCLGVSKNPVVWQVAGGWVLAPPTYGGGCIPHLSPFEAPEPGDILVALADGLTELRAELAREREARLALEERLARGAFRSRTADWEGEKGKLYADMREHRKVLEERVSSLQTELAREREARRALEERVTSLQTELVREREAKAERARPPISAPVVLTVEPVRVPKKPVIVLPKKTTHVKKEEPDTSKDELLARELEEEERRLDELARLSSEAERTEQETKEREEREREETRRLEEERQRVIARTRMERASAVEASRALRWTELPATSSARTGGARPALHTARPQDWN